MLFPQPCTSPAHLQLPLPRGRPLAEDVKDERCAVPYADSVAEHLLQVPLLPRRQLVVAQDCHGPWEHGTHGGVGRAKGGATFVPRMT